MALRNKPRLKIGFLTDNIISIGKYQTLIWEGASEAARKNDIDFIAICGGTLEHSPVNIYEKRRNSVYNLIKTDYFDGLIIITCVGSFISIDEFKSFHLHFSPIPTISIGRPMEDITSVVEENYSGMKQLVNHFINYHHKKRIAFIRGPLGLPEMKDRFSAYLDALKENNIEFDPEMVIIGDLMPESGKRAVEYLLDEKKMEIDAIIGVNDNMALGAMAELKKREISIPDKIAVGGYDDIEETAVSSPSLTTIKSPIKQLGYASVEILIKSLRGEIIPIKKTLNSELIVRESCGCSQTKFIHKHLKNNLNFSGLSGIKQHKNEIITSIIDQFNTSLDKQYIENRLNMLFDAFIKDIEERNPAKSFCPSLSLILNETVESDNNILFWHGVVSSFRTKTHEFLEEKDDIESATVLWDSAFLLIAHFAYRIPKLKMIQQEKQSETLRIVSGTIITLYDMQKLADIVMQELPRLNIKTFFMFIYKEAVAGKRCKELLSKKFYLTAAYHNGVKLDLINMQKEFYQKTFFEDFSKINKIFNKGKLDFLIEPLVFREENFGFAVYESEPKNNVIFETLTSQISSVIMSSILYHERLEVEEKLKSTLLVLEDTNKKLENLSIIDELTGLYNRRGFFTFAEQQKNLALRAGRNFLIFFADMDGLKKINDKYGHSEGDRALRSAVKILQTTFRKSDIISRIGGDEFVIITPDTPIENLDKIKNKINLNIKKFNENEPLPYLLDMSFGISEFNGRESTDIETLLALADKDLYNNKEKKKPADT